MKLSAYTPITDFDFKFINVYIDNLKDKVDEIIFIYTGNSFDCSNYEMYHKNIDIKFYNYPVAIPYKWPEGKIRNFAISKCKNDWILALDIDEVIDDSINGLILQEPYIYSFNFIPFWYDLKTVRVNVENDNHWYPNNIFRLYHKSLICYSENTDNHSFYPYRNSDIRQTNLNVYHLHYVDKFNNGILKPRDNRSGDFQKYENLKLDSNGVSITKEDYFILQQPELTKKYYALNTIEFNGNYPKCLK